MYFIFFKKNSSNRQGKHLKNVIVLNLRAFSVFSQYSKPKVVQTLKKIAKRQGFPNENCFQCFATVTYLDNNSSALWNESVYTSLQNWESLAYCVDSSRRRGAESSNAPLKQSRGVVRQSRQSKCQRKSLSNLIVEKLLLFSRQWLQLPQKAKFGGTSVKRLPMSWWVVWNSWPVGSFASAFSTTSFDSSVPWRLDVENLCLIVIQSRLVVSLFQHCSPPWPVWWESLVSCLPSFTFAFQVRAIQFFLQFCVTVDAYQ